MGVAETIPVPLEQRVARIAPRPFLRVGILMENADPIRSPAELPWWAERGVVAIGLAWAKPSRYADGNAVERAPSSGTSSQRGLTDLGRELVREMDRLHILHDASHLSDRAFDDLCAATTRTIIASHSNCRAITDPSGANQRHLTDAQIKEIARRGGVIGLNLFSPFLSRAASAAGARSDDATPPARATLADVYAHADHICQLTGSHEHVGLGSDMDGGFSAQRLPDDINGPDDLSRLADEFSARGMSDEAVHAFAWRNFARLFAAPRDAGPMPRVGDARRAAGA
jgi:membrane dipeptidase